MPTRKKKQDSVGRKDSLKHADDPAYLIQLLEEKNFEIQRLKLDAQRQIDESRYSAKVQEAVYKITALASGSESLEQFYASLHETISELLLAENFYIGLLNKESDAIELVYFVDSEDADDLPEQGYYQIPANAKGLSTYLLRAGETLLLNERDILQLEEAGEVERLGPGAKSWLGSPLKSEESLIGIIVVQSYSDEFYYESWHKELFEYVSNVIASTLERKKSRLHLENLVAVRTEELRKKIEQGNYHRETENALLRLLELANSQIGLSGFYAELHKIIGDFIYAENFYIALKNAESNTIGFQYYADTKDNTTIEELQQVPIEVISKSLTGYVFKTGKPLLIDRESLAEMCNQGVVNAQGPETMSWLGIPLILDGEVFGVMTLQSYVPDIVFKKKDMILMEYAAKPVATAIQRKKSQLALEKLVEKRTGELQLSNKALKKQIDEKEKAQALQNALYEIANLALGAEDMLTFYTSIHRILGDLFNAENFFIALYDEEIDALKFTYISDQKDHTDPSIPRTEVLHKDTLSYHLLKTGEPILLSEESFEELKDKFDIELVGSIFKSWIGAPLKDNQNSFGVMVVQSYREGVIYTDWHKDLLSYVSSQVATTILRKQAHAALESQVKSRTRELELEIESRKRTESTQSVLYQIANLANLDLELESFYQELHRIIGQLIYCENFYIALKDDKNDLIKMVYFVDTKEDYDLEKIAELPLETLKKSITGYVLASGIPLLADAKQVQEIAEREGLELMGEQTVCWMGIPLNIDGNIIGIMAVQSYIPEKIFSENDKELMLFVGQHVATALQRKRSKDYLTILVEQRTEELEHSNAELKKQIAETERSKRLQTALYQITDLASSAEDMDELYSSIHQIILQLIYAENFYICLYDDEKSSLEFVYLVDSVDDESERLHKVIPVSNFEQTLTGQVLNSGTSLLKTPENSGMIELKTKGYLGKRALYWLGVPLKIESTIIGMLAIQSYEESFKIGLDEKELLEFASHHIALTLERRQAQKALERRVVERTAKLAETNASLEQQILVRQRSEATQAALYYIANLANQNISLESMFEKIHRALSKLVYSENFYIALWNKEKDEMEWAYFVDQDKEYDYGVSNELPEEERKKTFARYVVMNARPLLVNKSQALRMSQDKVIRFIGPVPEYYLGVPLIGNDGPIGVMAVQSYDFEISFNESDQELMNFVAQSIVSTIERRDYNINLEAKVERRTQELTITNEKLHTEISQRKESEELQKALFEISETYQSCETEKELYAKLHQIISRLMYANSFYIALINEEEQCFNFDYVKDEVDKDIPESIPIGRSLTSYVYRKKETVHINKKEIGELEAAGEITHMGSYAVDWVGVPLMSDNVTLGIMILQSYNELYSYGEREIGILNFVSTHIANALQNKRAEKDLKIANAELAIKTQKAEEANKAKSAFLATVSHEIRTPMNGILGMLSLLGDTKLTSQQRDYVDKISTSSASLLDIINDILDFSKIERGRLELENRKFNLIEVLDNIVDVFSSRINEKNLEFNIDLGSEVALERTGDSLRLSQILINLIGNAIKFTDKGFINLRINRREKDRLLFVVEDSGIGIEPEKRELIFSSFTQADDTTTRKFGGSGLGLSICQQLVQLMDGWIKVDGELGVGSQFSFEVAVNVDDSKIYDLSEFVGANLLLVSESKRQIVAWQHLCEKFEVEFTSIDYKTILDEQCRIPENVSHIFINEKSNTSNYQLIEKTVERINVSTPCFFLARPIPDLTSIPRIHERVEMLDKPSKMGLILSLLKYDFDAIKQMREHNQATNQIRPALVGKQILLAEDNPINQQVASEILNKAGVKVSIVNNGKEAVVASEKNNYDLILMDMQMPVMDGYQASLKIREKFSMEELPIIAMTANVMKGDREKCLEHGMNDYIAKPINRAVFFATIEHMLREGKKNQDKAEPISQDMIKIEQNRTSVQAETSSVNDIDAVLDVLTAKFESRELAEQLMEMFFNNHKEDEDKIRTLIDKDDLKNAEKVVHKLKGSLGELELSSLHHSASCIDEKLKNNSKPDSYTIESFFEEINIIFDGMKEKISE